MAVFAPASTKNTNGGANRGVFAPAFHIQRKKPGNEAWLSVYPRSESNRDRQNRNLKFYPLNYRGIPVKGLQI